MSGDQLLLSRYRGASTIALGDERRPAFRSSPAAHDPERGLAHSLVYGETLDHLALRYYGSEALWWVIADANPGRFPDDWRPGDRLLIPPLRNAWRGP